MNIIYLRVSKEEESMQDLEPQLAAILEKFNLIEKDCLILKERGSAYKMDQIKKRKEFLRLINIAFSAEHTTISQLFLSDFKHKEINLYIWDYHRIMRNFEFSLLFSLLSDTFHMNIYSYKQGIIKKKEEETPIEKFARYIFSSINAFSAEDYSYHTSENIKKAVKKEQGITISSKGNKWGSQFIDLKTGKYRTKESAEFVVKLNKYILRIARNYEKEGVRFFYDFIITKVGKKFGIKISKAYISLLRKNDKESKE